MSSVYTRAYDPKRPVICVNRKLKLLQTNLPSREPQSLRPSVLARSGYECERRDTANIFLSLEPLGGKHQVWVTQQRTKADFAELLCVLADEVYVEVEVIVSVCDNLHTHRPHVLYESFALGEARWLSERFEWHHTPEHGSWLNMVEIELDVLNWPCLERRFGAINLVRQEVAPWE